MENRISLQIGPPFRPTADSPVQRSSVDANKGTTIQQQADGLLGLARRLLLADGRLRGGDARDGHAVGRAARVVQTQLLDELNLLCWDGCVMGVMGVMDGWEGSV